MMPELVPVLMVSLEPLVMELVIVTLVNVTMELMEMELVLVCLEHILLIAH